MIKVAIINDTRVTSHYGCMLVMENLLALLEKNDVEIVWTWDVSIDWRKYKSKIQNKPKVDAIIVNGEGTIHHSKDRKFAKALAEFAQFSKISLLICSDSYSDKSPEEFRAQIIDISTVKNLPLLVLSQQESHEPRSQIIATSAEIADNRICLFKPFKQQYVLSALFALTQFDKFKPLLTKLEHTPAINVAIDTPHGKENKAPQQLIKPSILVVDDESSNIDVAAGNLRQLYRVIAAKSGEHALKIINSGKHKIELVLLDIMMPEMDGYQVCSALKNNPKTTNIPVIFLSAKSEVSDIKYGFDLGAVDYITKPLNGDLLRARVATHIRLQQQNTALADQVTTLRENAKLREDIEKITHHDLKGPLNNILFETYRLADKAAAKSINKAVNNVVDMINNSLNLYKIEQNIYQLTPQRIDLNQMITDAINACLLYTSPSPRD